MILEIRWLRSFVSVADEMHFSRAASKLNLAQPALTAQIRQLEEAVGARLFQRSNRMEGLTTAGRALLPEARMIVERSAQLSGLVKRASLGETGSLRLGVIPPAATSHLAACIRRFSATFPGVEFSVRQGDQDKLIDRLAGNDLDLVIGRPTSNRQQGATLCQDHLFSEEQGILVSEEDPLASLRIIPIKKISDRNLLLLRGNIHFGQVLLAHAAKHGSMLLPLYTAEDFPSLHWMVRAGLGIAPCSMLLADGLPRGLIARQLSPAPPMLEIYGIWRGAKPEAVVSKLMALLKKHA